MTLQAPQVRVSYAEIYNEQFSDLLCPGTESSDMAVMDDAGGGVFVKGLSQHLAGCRVYKREGGGGGSSRG